MSFMRITLIFILLAGTLAAQSVEPTRSTPLFELHIDGPAKVRQAAQLTNVYEMLEDQSVFSQLRFLLSMFKTTDAKGERPSALHNLPDFDGHLSVVIDAHSDASGGVKSFGKATLDLGQSGALDAIREELELYRSHADAGQLEIDDKRITWLFGNDLTAAETLQARDEARPLAIHVDIERSHLLYQLVMDRFFAGGTATHVATWEHIASLTGLKNLSFGVGFDQQRVVVDFEARAEPDQDSLIDLVRPSSETRLLDRVPSGDRSWVLFHPQFDSIRSIVARVGKATDWYDSDEFEAVFEAASGVRLHEDLLAHTTGEVLLIKARNEPGTRSTIDGVLAFALKDETAFTKSLSTIANHLQLTDVQISEGNGGNEGMLSLLGKPIGFTVRDGVFALGSPTELGRFSSREPKLSESVQRVLDALGPYTQTVSVTRIEDWQPMAGEDAKAHTNRQAYWLRARKYDLGRVLIGSQWSQQGVHVRLLW